MRIAHLSDLHILDARANAKRARYRVATQLVSLGRRVDPTLRGRRLARALSLAKESGAEHLVISGDLTEVGESSEFEHLAEILHTAGFPDDHVTLVPGNHDAYTAENAWSRALQGPLARFAPASATVAGKIVERGAVAFLPIDSSCFQNIARSAGVFTRATAEALGRRLTDPCLRDKAIVLVLHHPPFHPNRIVEIWDGLRGCAEVLELLAKNPRLQLLHGHLHRVVDRILSSSTGRLRTERAEARAHAPTRMFGAPATCDDPDDAPRIRLYDVKDGALHATDRPTFSPKAA